MNKAAQTLGRRGGLKGGRSRSEAKTSAARINAAKATAARIGSKAVCPVCERLISFAPVGTDVHNSKVLVWHLKTASKECPGSYRGVEEL